MHSRVTPGEEFVRQRFLAMAAIIDRATRFLCMATAVVMTLTLLIVVVLRYGFGTGNIALQDLASYAFAIFLVLAVPACLAQGGHVRVEVFSEAMPPSYLARADLVAFLLFLLPVFGLALWAYWPEISYSWTIRERSVETGGLPGLFIVKTALPVAAVLMIVQGAAMVLRAFAATDAER